MSLLNVSLGRRQRKSKTQSCGLKQRRLMKTFQRMETLGEEEEEEKKQTWLNLSPSGWLHSHDMARSRFELQGKKKKQIIRRFWTTGERRERLGETTWWDQTRSDFPGGLRSWSLIVSRRPGTPHTPPRSWTMGSEPPPPDPLNSPTVLHKYVSGGKPRALLKDPALPRKVTQWGQRFGWMWLSVQGGHK